MSKKKILFTGGGSAGHVVPNLAVMQELRREFDLLYLGTGGIDEVLVTNAGYPFFRVECPKLVRKFTAENLRIPAKLRRANREALAVLRREKPALVFSKGGYASYPAVWAAHRLKIPVLTHESDLSPGLCTRLIARKCAYVLTSFPETAAKFPNGKWVGSPVRKEVLEGNARRARRKFGLPEKGPVLLVFGGGSGSHVLNTALENALPALLENFSVLHLSGLSAPLPSAVSPCSAASSDGKNSPLDSENCGHGVEKNRYVVREYEPDMGSAYAASDIVLCRAGSNTVFEVMALGKRAVFVPLVRSSRGDQLENARYFEEKGLAKILPESQLDLLPDVVKDAWEDKKLLNHLNDLHYSSGTDDIVAMIREFVGEGAETDGASE